MDLIMTMLAFFAIEIHPNCFSVYDTVNNWGAVHLLRAFCIKQAAEHEFAKA